MSKTLSEIKILLAESDSNLGVMLSQVLLRMGFKSVQVVRDGQAALEALSNGQRDILITEWQLPGVDGLELTRRIRQSEHAATRLLPVIMMTARAERQDVETARDTGINEFIVKPFTSGTVFRRIQQVVDNPRGFLLAPVYVGPDRRRKVLDVNGHNRRKITPQVTAEPPQLVLPDYVLKKKLGDVETLDSIITPAVLEAAQKVIDDLKDVSLQWIGKDVAKLNALYKDMVAGGGDESLAAIQEVLLSIKAQAGTFGYTNAGLLAYQLYQFLRYDFVQGSGKHNHVLIKHIQSITVLLGNQAAGHSLEKENWLMQALKQMVGKFKQEK